jgi:hypothetical protein
MSLAPKDPVSQVGRPWVAPLLTALTLAVVVGLPVTFLLTEVIYRHGSRTSLFLATWLALFWLLSLGSYAALELLRGARGSDVLLQAGILALCLSPIGLTVPSYLLGAADRGKQSRAMRDLRQIGQVVESLQHRRSLPALHGQSVLALGPCGEALLRWDPWGGEYRVFADSAGYAVISGGSDQALDLADPDDYDERPTIDFEDDIVLRNGHFVRWPEGQRRP